MLNLIFCVDNSGLFGRDNEMVWNFKEELKYFKDITTNFNRINNLENLRSSANYNTGSISLSSAFSLFLLIKHFNSLSSASKDDLSFFGDIKYSNDLKKSHAGACILSEKDLAIMPDGMTAIICENPSFTWARILKDFLPKEIIPFISLIIFILNNFI